MKISATSERGMTTFRRARFRDGTAQRLAGIALTACCLALPARAEIGVQNSGGGLNGSFNVTSYTQSVTVSDVDERILVVSIHTRNWYSPASVTYGGTALTYATGSRAEAGVSYNGVRTQLFYLLNPPVGTATLLTDPPGSYTTQWTAGSSGTFCQSVIAFAAALPTATLITVR